jgi:hypothetical protein
MRIDEYRRMGHSEAVHLKRGDSFLVEHLHCAVFFSFRIKSIILGQVSNMFVLLRNLLI